MKRMICIWVAIGVAWAWQGAVLAGPVGGIQLISQQHRVWGFAGSATQWQPGGTEVPYDVTSPDPLTVSVTGSYMMDESGMPYFLTATSEAGNFRVETEAAYWFSLANAQSSYTFVPQEGVYALVLDAQAGGWGVGINEENTVSFTFDDLTAGVQLANFTAPTNADWDFPPSDWTYALGDTYSVDPTHTYSMMLFSSAGIADSDRGAWLDVSVSSVVPAPGAVLLAVLGSGGVGWLRKRRFL